MLRWTLDEWRRLTDTQSTLRGWHLISWTSKSRPDRAPPLRFTFFWLKDSRWEGCDFQVSCTP
jgi:hypothetical protein